MRLKPGIMLLEVIIALSLMALLAAVAVPNFRARFPQQLTNKFVSDLNSLTSVAWQDSIVTGRLHRVVFDFEKRKVDIEIEKKEAVGRSLDEAEAFEPINSGYINYIYYPKHLDIRSFYVAGTDELNGSTNRAWFFITPLGITQEVMINVEDTSKPNLEEPDVFGLVLNPFSAQFKKHETAQEPI